MREKKAGINSFIRQIYGKKFTWVALSVALVCIVGSLAQMLLTVLMGRIIDAIDKGFKYVLPLFLIIAAAMIVYISFNTLWTYLSSNHTNRLMTKLRDMLDNAICHADFTSLEAIKDGDVLSIVTNDVEGIRNWINILFQMGFLPVKFGLALGVCFFISWKMTIIVLPLVPIILALGMLFSANLYQLNVSEKEGQGKINAFLNDALSFMIVIKSFCLEKIFAKKNKAILDDVAQIKKMIVYRENAVFYFNTSIGYVGFVAIFLVGSLYVVSGEMTIGEMISFIFIANFVGEGINIIQAIPISYRNACAAQHRIKKLLSLPVDGKIKLVVDSRIMPLPSADVFTFDDVSFAYSEQNMILHNISLSIQQGEKIAVIGMSGSGKTTLFKLMCGLYHATTGKLTYYGENVNDIASDKLRSDLAVAPQESFLFIDTIRNNVKISRPSANDEEMVMACKNAQIHDFIVDLPQGYDTKLKNINKAMSRGQMQRLNLARVFLKAAPVLLLDEPTSALDISTHNAVMRYLTQELPGKTIIMIIHRLTEPERFDKIIVMEDGRLVGFGYHDTLIGSNPSYKAMLGRMSEEYKESEVSAV